jgi:hypothetical protein
LFLADGLRFREDIFPSLTGTGDTLAEAVTKNGAPFANPLSHAVHDLLGVLDFRPLGWLLTGLLSRRLAGLFALFLTH